MQQHMYNNMKKPKRSNSGSVNHIKKRLRKNEDNEHDNGLFQIIPKELVASVASTNQDLHNTVLYTNSIWKVCFEKRFIWSLSEDRMGERFNENRLYLQEKRDWKNEFINRCKTEENWRKGNFVVHTFKGHSDWVRCLQFMNDTLISGSADKSIKIWNMNNRKCKSTLYGHSRCINSLSYDKGKLASACTSVKIWDLSNPEDIEEENGRNLCKLTLRGHEDCVWCLQLKGNLCVSGSSDKTLRMWDIEQGKCLQTFTGHTDCVCCLQLIPHKNLLLSGSSDSTIRCYDLRAKECQSILETHSDRVWCLQSEGDLLVTGASDKTIKVWDMRTRKCTRVFSGHTNSVWGLQMIGDKLVSGSADSTVRLWDLKKQDPCVNVINPNVGCVECLQFEGSRLVCGSSDSVIKMYDFSS